MASLVQMFARCLHFWAKTLVSPGRQPQSHWWTAVAPVRGDGCDTEGRGELQPFNLSVQLKTGPAEPTHPAPPPPPLQASYDGNTGRGLWIIGNFNPLKAIIQNKTFQIYSSVESSCLFRACAPVLETLPCFCPHILSFASLISALIALM